MHKEARLQNQSMEAGIRGFELDQCFPVSSVFTLPQETSLDFFSNCPLKQNELPNYSQIENVCIYVYVHT